MRGGDWPASALFALITISPLVTSPTSTSRRYLCLELLLARLSIKSILWYWGPAVLMLVFIGFESTDLMSASQTSGWFLPLLRKLFPWASLQTIHVVHVAARKFGHVFGYALLSFLLFRGWWGTAKQSYADAGSWRMRFAVFGFAGAALVGVADELHQMTIPSRGGSVLDILLDSAAALSAQVIIAYVLRRRTRPAALYTAN